MIIIHSCSDIAAILTVFIFKSYMYFLFQNTLNRSGINLVISKGNWMIIFYKVNSNNLLCRLIWNPLGSQTANEKYDGTRYFNRALIFSGLFFFNKTKAYCIIIEKPSNPSTALLQTVALFHKLAAHAVFNLV